MEINYQMSWRTLAFLAPVGTSFLYAINDVVGLGIIFNVDSLVRIYLPSIMAATYSEARKRGSFPITLQAMGLSLGVFISCFDFLVSLSVAGDAKQFYGVIGSCFLGIFHGGLIASLGYFFSKQSMLDCSPVSSLRDNFAYVSIVFATVAVSLALKEVTLHPFIEINTIVIFGSIIGMVLILSGKQLTVKRFTRGLVFAVSAPALLSIIGWVISYPDPRSAGPAVAIGLLGILYGSFCLLLCALVCTRNSENVKHLWRANWHLLEIYALVVLVIFSPVSIIELLETSPSGP